MITIKRSLVKKPLSQSDSLDLLRQGLAEMAGQKLGRFAEAVCGLFDCCADHGKPQKTTCAQALKERDRKEFISLESSLGDKLERSALRSWKAFLQRRFEEGVPVSLKGARAGAVLRFSTPAVSASRLFRHWAGAARDEARAMEAWRARPTPAAPERSWSGLALAEDRWGGAGPQRQGSFWKRKLPWRPRQPWISRHPWRNWGTP